MVKSLIIYQMRKKYMDYLNFGRKSIIILSI